MQLTTPDTQSLSVKIKGVKKYFLSIQNVKVFVKWGRFSRDEAQLLGRLWVILNGLKNNSLDCCDIDKNLTISIEARTPS